MFIFPYIGNNNPNWLIFFRGVETTNQIKIVKPDPTFSTNVIVTINQKDNLQEQSWGVQVSVSLI